MSAEQIAKKLWDLCNVLRDDGVTYHQYLNELTYILFLRLSEVRYFMVVDFDMIKTRFT